MRRYWILFLALLLVACGVAQVQPGNRLTTATVDIADLAVVFPSPKFDGPSMAGGIAESNWNKMRPALESATLAMLARNAVSAQIYPAREDGKPLTTSQRYVLVIEISSAFYSSRLGASQTLSLQLIDKKREQRIWYSAAQLASGLKGIFGKWDDLAGDLTSGIEDRLKEDGLLPLTAARKSSEGGTTTAQASTNEEESNVPLQPAVWSAEAKRAYEVYKGRNDPRAFVLDQNGRFEWLSGHQWDGRPPSSHALKRCADKGGVGCRVVDIDGHLKAP